MTSEAAAERERIERQISDYVDRLEHMTAKEHIRQAALSRAMPGGSPEDALLHAVLAVAKGGVQS